MDDIKKQLCAAPFFSPLSGAALERVAKTARFIDIGKNQTLFSRGEEADAAYIIAGGQIAIEVLSGSGRVARVATIGVNAIFGELAILDNGARTADARAINAATLVRIPSAIIIEMFETEPAFARAVMQDLTAKLRSTNDQVESIALKSLASRLAGLLLTLGVDKDGNPGVITTTQSELAERLLATREKVNIHLQTLQRAGAIILSRGRIKISNLESLDDAANHD